MSSLYHRQVRWGRTDDGRCLPCTTGKTRGDGLYVSVDLIGATVFIICIFSTGLQRSAFRCRLDPFPYNFAAERKLARAA
jgi:hypothetical protein